MKKGKIFLVLVILMISGYLIYSYVYKSHRDIASEKGSFLVTAMTLHSEFKADEKKANAKYLDKTLSVYGKITNIDPSQNAIIIDNRIFAIFKEKIPAELEVLSNVKIKGRFLGYDDLLEELKMDQCVTDN